MHRFGTFGPGYQCNSKHNNRERKSDRPSLIESGERCERTHKEKEASCRARHVRPGAEPKQLLAGTVLFDHAQSADVP